MNIKSFAYVSSPRSGMANRFLVWAKAKVFSKKYGLGFYTSDMYSVHVGPIIRKEKSKRFYFDYFIKQSFIVKLKLEFIFLFMSKKYNCKFNENINLNNSAYIFNQLDWTNYFNIINLHRDYLITEFYKIINPKYLKLNDFEEPIVSIHIRRGDFKVGYSLTPNEYFIDAINYLRNNIQYFGVVHIFTDADNNEISDITNLINVQLYSTGNDLQDLLMLSKSKVIFVSNGSTYSYWSSFLSNSIIIRYDEDKYGKIRIEENLFEYYWPSELEHSIPQIKNILK